MAEHALVSQPSAKPTLKVLATWITGAGATFTLALVALLSDSVDSSTVWGGLLVGALSGAAGYLKKARVSEPAA